MHFVVMPKGPASRKGKKRPRHNDDDEPEKEESPPDKAVTRSRKLLKLYQILFFPQMAWLNVYVFSPSKLITFIVLCLVTNNDTNC